MGLPITGYSTVELIRATRFSRTYEAVRDDGLEVIARVFDLSVAGVGDHLAFECELARAHELRGVVPIVGVEQTREQLVVLSERVPSVDLSEFSANQAMPLDTFLPVARELAEALVQLHARRLLAWTLSPASVRVGHGGGEVYVLDFGTAAAIEHELLDPDDIELYANMVRYAAPELSGRTRHQPGPHTDLYALGATFYELLTGVPPFAGDSAEELEDAHLFETPEPPNLHRPELPPALDRLVMKLLEKQPEDRYHSAVGVAADLRRLKAEVDAGTELAEVEFELGVADVLELPALSGALHGRERELTLLTSELERAARGDRPRVVLLSGASGSGKSALTEELEDVMIQRRGLLGRGSFEGNRAVPYAGWFAAIDDAIGQLLLGHEELGRFEVLVRERVGILAAVLVDYLPNLRRLLDEPVAEPAAMSLNEARNRFHLALARLLGCLAELGDLALILENLHSADSGSLELLNILLDRSDCGSTLFVCTSRRDAVHEGHPIRVLAAALRNRERNGRAVDLRALTDSAVTEFLDAMLGIRDEDFARFITSRTSNNPEFVFLLLEHLLRMGLLERVLVDEERGAGQSRWRWSLEEFETASIPADIYGLIDARVSDLPRDSAALLREAACLGSAFDLNELCVATDRAPRDTLKLLQPLLEDDLLLATRTGYRFRRARVREFAVNQMSATTRRELYTRRGRALLEGEPTRLEFFTAVHYLGQSRAHADHDEHSRARLVALQLEAGKCCLELAAYDMAMSALNMALEVLHERRPSAEAIDDRLFEITLSRALALSLSGRADVATSIFEELGGWALSPVQRAQLVAQRTRLLVLQGEAAAALEVGLRGLAECGFKLNREPSRVRVLVSVVRAWMGVRKLSEVELGEWPSMTDPVACAAMEISSALVTSSYIVAPLLFAELTAFQVRLFLDHGKHPGTGSAFAQLAMAVGWVLRRPVPAGALADQAMALVDGEQPTLSAVRAEMGGALFVWHMSRPYKDCVARLDVTYERALVIGDFENAGYVAALGLSVHPEVGTDLRGLLEFTQRVHQDIGARLSKGISEIFRVNGSLLAALVGDLDAEFGELARDEDTPRVVPVEPGEFDPETDNRVWFYANCVVRAMFHLIMGEAEAALAYCLRITDFAEVLRGSWSTPRAALLYALATAMELEREGAELDGRGHRRRRRVIVEQLDLLQRWAHDSPHNFGHYRDFVAAELAVLDGDDERAMGLYEQTRAEANVRGCLYVAALACERMAAHMERRAYAVLAQGPRQEAWELYRLWGARAKLRQLEDQFGLNDNDAIPTRRAKGRGSSSNRHANLALDLETITTTLTAISEELDPEAVICKVLEAAMTNAGADRGALLVETEDGLCLAALGGMSRRVQTIVPPLELGSAAAMVPVSVVEYVIRTDKTVVLDDARVDVRFASDSYISRTGVRSLLCMPIGKGKRRLGALVLENRQSASCFSEDRLGVLDFVAAQAGGALDNANLYRALRRSEVQWRSLVDGAPDIIALLDDHGDLTFVNRPLPGWVPGQAPAMEDESVEVWEGAIEAALEQGRRGEAEICITKAASSGRGKGTRRWYEAHIAPIEIEDEPRRVMVIATEITERKNADARRLELEAQLRQQQRLESIGTLASGVAHEINNPVQGILNYAELLGMSREEPELVSEFAGEIAGEAERVATIVRDLLAFSRRDNAPKRTPTQISKIVGSTLSLIRSTLRKDQIDLRNEIPINLPEVLCHSQQIQQIVMNLVTNARDAINERWKGHDERKIIRLSAAAVRVRGEPEPDEDSETLVEGEGPESKAGLTKGDKPNKETSGVSPILVGFDEDARDPDEDPDGDPRWVRLSVTDTGTGIPDEVLAHIFDPFFTTKGRDQGTGLGLSLSHGIARDHGGELWVETKPGEGTTFHLDLPVVMPGEYQD
ncbi:sensor histidine kinase [Plesiocystis pacifica SIR-1]|uniref:histidine kinase n=1 Tax=Plesiocystis pacifica SIR-1 TaxID=391625 RepID=A6FZT9_9BACT|nr:ATP-binding protein [Plesiocystis pacifica]EDM80895.1 sensor histidine kinase [Plesiocystis pacifica SIR-1]